MGDATMEEAAELDLKGATGRPAWPPFWIATIYDSLSIDFFFGPSGTTIPARKVHFQNVYEARNLTQPQAPS